VSDRDPPNCDFPGKIQKNKKIKKGIASALPSFYATAFAVLTRPRHVGSQIAAVQLDL
jgi:hypothetical protein